MWNPHIYLHIATPEEQWPNCTKIGWTETDGGFIGCTEIYGKFDWFCTVSYKRKNLEFQMLAAVYHKGDHGQYCYTLMVECCKNY